MSHKKEQSRDGIIPRISNHTLLMPQLFEDLEDCIVQKLSDTISGQFVMGTQSMLVKWIFKKGAVVPLHFHPNEQITWITSGIAEVTSQGKTFLLKQGSIMIFPPYIPHEFLMLEDTIDFDFFSPIRDDWFRN
jgi:quercetin dioxygenase-like cupin family protein